MSEINKSRDEIINSICQRIESEMKKHKDLNWIRIAAFKIYAEHIPSSSKVKLFKDEE